MMPIVQPVLIALYYSSILQSRGPFCISLEIIHGPNVDPGPALILTPYKVFDENKHQFYKQWEIYS